MPLLVLIGAQAVGKMTVGRELEKRIDGKLLFNHQTIDLFANYLGYTPAAFQLSNSTRIELFKAFVADEKNTAKTIIFTVLVGFDQKEDLAFLHNISDIFLHAGHAVYFVELVAHLEERIARNRQEERLKAKPSKRDLAFSHQELLSANKKYRLESKPEELASLFPKVKTMKIDNTKLSPEVVSQNIITTFQLDSKKGPNPLS